MRYKSAGIKSVDFSNCSSTASNILPKCVPFSLLCLDSSQEKHVHLTHPVQQNNFLYLYIPYNIFLNHCLSDCIFFSQKDFYYRHISAIFEWTLSVNLELFELSYAVEFYFFSSAMLSVLLSNRDEENTIILS